jgi:hypothetical protein
MTMLSTKTAFSVAMATVLLAVFASRLHAQVSTASIQGTVRDSSGAGIPAAAIVLHNNSTNVDTNTASNGTYSLRVSKAG